MHKIVINDCYGGFGLSPSAVKRYYELKYPSTPVYFYIYERYEGFEGGSGLKYKYTKVDFPEDIDLRDRYAVLTKDHGKSFVRDSFFYDEKEYIYCNPERTDPILIQVVEELGKEANTRNSRLKIVKFSGDKYRICEYDGLEYVETPDSIHWKTV